MVRLYSRIQRISQAVERMRAVWTRGKDSASFPALVSKPSGTNIVVLSPHPDDDVIGCGGTLIKLAQGGHRVASIYLTDGSRGGPSRTHGHRLAKTREEEARKAARIIGLSKPMFLGYKDGALKTTRQTVARLEEMLETIRPDLIFVPFFLDPHPDHAATHEMFMAAAERLSFPFFCCAYETWVPLVPNILVDITEQMAGKLAAIEHHRSQRSPYDYVRAVSGLNAYRAIQNVELARAGRFAEAFFYADRERYLSSHRRKG